MISFQLNGKAVSTEALAVQRGLEEELESLRRDQPGPLSPNTRKELLALAEDLPKLWNHPDSSPEFKKRILRAVLVEIVARLEKDVVHLVLHWQGGDHTQLQFQKVRTGQHRHVTAADTIELIRSLATIQPDPMIASVLNRLGRRTAHDRTWNARRVCSIRHHHGIPVFREGERQARGELTVKEVAALLDVSSTKVLRMIRRGQLPATQLRKRQDSEVFGTRQGADAVIPFVSGYQSMERFPRQEIHDLRKQRLSGIHPALSATRVSKEAILPDLRSSQGHPICSVTYCNRIENCAYAAF